MFFLCVLRKCGVPICREREITIYNKNWVNFVVIWIFRFFPLSPKKKKNSDNNIIYADSNSYPKQERAKYSILLFTEKKSRI